ncbi:MAG: DUF4382 domain-containing protein [Bacteroidia bacterium]|nr:DUF4382 domain-containing protein [Bacteroidia bacterium]NNJ55228.1 DUF4382 domain-containing protein [Bacteroidia bacterium]
MRNLLLVAVGLTILGVVSCKENVEMSPDKATLAFRLTDAPCDYDNLFIDVQGIEIHSDSNGWESLTPFNSGVYDILELTNGLDTLLCQVDLPAGTVSQIRLMLGENNSLVTGGTSYDLKTPSAQQSGLKLNLHKELLAGTSYTVWLDFDACKSIVQKGNGGYSLKPVIRVFSDSTDGKLKGVIMPDTISTQVHVIQNSDTITSIPNNDGSFVVCGLDGTYDVLVESFHTNYNDSMISSVSVGFGEIVDLDTVRLQ